MAGPGLEFKSLCYRLLISQLLCSPLSSPALLCSPCVAPMREPRTTQECFTLPSFLPSAWALECALCYPDLSPDSKSALKADFTDQHFLVGSLFFMVYLVYYQLGTAWHLLSCLLDPDLLSQFSVLSEDSMTIWTDREDISGDPSWHDVSQQCLEAHLRIWGKGEWGRVRGVAFPSSGGWWWAQLGCLKSLCSSGNCLRLGRSYYWCFAFLYYFTFAKCFPVIY